MLDVKAFGDARTQAWAQRINDAQNSPANKGFEQAGKNHPDYKATNHTEYKKTVKETAPPPPSQSSLMKTVGSLGSGIWEAVA